MRLFLSSFFIFSLIIISCTKPEETTTFVQANLNTTDLLTSVHVDENDQITILGGFVWSHCDMYEGPDPFSLKKASFSNKLLFDLKPDKNNRLLAVGVDGYMYSKNENDIWTFHRSTGWDILHCIRDSGNRIISGGGKSYQKGYLYFYNRDLDLDSIQYFDFEISDFVLLGRDTIVAAGYGRVIRSEDGGATWKTMNAKGDFYASVGFKDKNKGWLAGFNGSLLQTRDGGITWQNISKRLKGSGINSFRKLVLLDDRIVLLGNKGKFWYSSDDGQNWTYAALPTQADLYDMVEWKNKLIVVGSDGLAGVIDK